jgi:hypothetical protein
MATGDTRHPHRRQTDPPRPRRGWRREPDRTTNIDAAVALAMAAQAHAYQPETVALLGWL